MRVLLLAQFEIHVNTPLVICTTHGALKVTRAWETDVWGFVMQMRGEPMWCLQLIIFKSFYYLVIHFKAYYSAVKLTGNVCEEE